MGKLCFKTGEYLMMKKLPIKSIYLRRLESYSMETKMLRYKDFFPDENAFGIEATRVKHSAIKIDTRVEEHHLPAIDEESKESIQNELDDTNVKSLLDTIGIRSKGIADDKSSQSYSTRSESMYKNFKNRISMTKKRSAGILKKVKIGFLMSLFFNTIVYSILFTVLQASVQEYSEGTDTVLTLGNLRYDLLKAAYLARKLYENDSGYQITESREEILTSLLKIRDNLKVYTNDLKDTEVGQGLDTGIQFDSYVWWYNQQNEFTPGDLNIIDSSKRVNVLINNIVSQPSLFSQPDFFELYRNTPFELNRNLNNTSLSFIAAYKDYVEDHLDLIMIIFNVVVNFKFLIKLVLILYIFTVLNKIRKKIFTSLIAGSKVNLNIAMVKIKDRLVFLHNNEESSTIDIEERIKSKSRLTYCQHRYQKIVYILITIVVSLMAFIIVFPNILTTPNLIKILDEEVSHLYLDTELKNLILYGYLSAREMGLPISANLSNQNFINPQAELDECLSEIDYTSRLAFEAVRLSTNIEEIYLGTSNISNSLNTGVFEYMLLLRDMPISSDSNTYIAYLESHQAYMENLVVLSNKVEGIIKEDSDSLLMNELSKIFEIIMLMIAVQGIVLFIGFFPLLSKFERVLDNEIEILLYLPREDNNLQSSKYDK
jgi:hypothetical protein